MTRSPTQVITCPPELRAEALRRLHQDVPQDQRASLAQAIESAANDPVSWDGLLVVLDETATTPRVGSTAWLQRLPGNTGMLWPPAADDPALVDLVTAAASFVDKQRLPLAQFLASELDGYSGERLGLAGFPKFADLLYLFAEARRAETNSLAELELESRAGDHLERLAALLERTYIGTQDCPQLDGVRPLAEVVAGYRRQGEYLPQHWYIVRQRGRDVAALILAHHSSAGNLELVYMGVVPEARGQNLGERLAWHARGAAAAVGAERLVLAVDAANAPALAAYERAGFQVWDRRIVYARLRSPSQL